MKHVESSVMCFLFQYHCYLLFLLIEAGCIFLIMSLEEETCFLFYGGWDGRGAALTGSKPFKLDQNHSKDQDMSTYSWVNTYCTCGSILLSTRINTFFLTPISLLFSWYTNHQVMTRQLIVIHSLGNTGIMEYLTSMMVPSVFHNFTEIHKGMQTMEERAIIQPMP